MPKHYDDTYEMNNNGKNPNNKLPVAPKSPVKNHGCTDIICSIVFVIFIGKNSSAPYLSKFIELLKL